MATFSVKVGNAEYDVDAPDENTAWQWANIEHQKTLAPASESGTMGRMMRMLPSSFNKGVAGGLDVLLNAPTNIKNIGVSAAGLGALAADKPDLAMSLSKYVSPQPNYARRLFEKVGAVEPIEPQTAGERIVDVAAQGAGGALMGPGASLPALARSAGVGAVSGGAGQGVAEVTGSPVAGAIAGLAAPSVPSGVARGGRLASLLASDALGFTTGAGSKAVREAAAAGYKGGSQAEAFQRNLRQAQANSYDVVNDAKKALDRIREDRSLAYRSGMVDIKNDKTILDTQPIVDKVREVQDRGVYKGKVIDKSASNTWDEINEAVQSWVKDNPADFHTPEGVDALKRRIGDIRDSLPFDTPARNAASNVYRAVRDQISNQAPGYARTMKDYEEASDVIEELEKSLSLGQKALPDTALRKLQSIMRNNANTNYGRREALGNILAEKGADTLFPSLAGQALSSPLPRSISGTGSAIGAGYAAMQSLPGGALTLLATSPRLVGEAAYYAGKAAGVPAASMAKMLDKYGDNPGIKFLSDYLQKAKSQADPRIAKMLATQLMLMQQNDERGAE